MDQITSEEINRRKETLNSMYAEFNRLKEEKKWSEAWDQLIKTLNYANETMKFAAELIKNKLSSNPEYNNTLNEFESLINKSDESLSNTSNLSAFGIQQEKDAIKEIDKKIPESKYKVEPKIIAIPKNPKIH